VATTAIRFIRVPAAPVLADLPRRLSPLLRCSPASAPKSLHLQPDLLSKATPTPTAPLRRAGSRPVHTWTLGTVDPGWGRPGRGWVPTDLPPNAEAPLVLPVSSPGAIDPKTGDPWTLHPRSADVSEASAPTTRRSCTRHALQALPHSPSWPPQGPFPGPASSAPGFPPPCPVGFFRDDFEWGSRLQGLAPLTSPLRLPSVSRRPAPVAPLGFYVPPRPLPRHRGASLAWRRVVDVKERS